MRCNYLVNHGGIVARGLAASIAAGLYSGLAASIAAGLYSGLAAGLYSSPVLALHS